MDKEQLTKREAKVSSWPIVLNGDELVWSLALTKNLETEAPGAGHIALSLDIAGLGDLTSIGRLLLEEIEIAYISRVQKGYLAAVKEALAHAIDFTKEELPDGKFSLSMGVVVDGVVYLGTIGQAQIFLHRKKTFSKVLGFDPGEKEEEILSSHLIKAASGFWQDDDIFIFASGNFAKEDKLVGIVKSSFGDRSSLEDNVETLATTTRSLEKGESLAAVVVGVSLDGDLKTPQEQLRTVGSKLGLANKAFGALSFFREKLKLPNLRLPFFSKRQAEAMTNRYLPDPVARAKRRRQVIFLVCALVLVLIGSVVYSQVKSRNAQNQRQVEAIVAQAEGIYDQALKTGNITERRVLLEDARKKIEQAKSINRNWSKVRDLDKKIAQAIADSLQVKNLGAMEVFYDLNIIKDGAKGWRMDFDDDKLVVLDKTNGSIYEVGRASKSGDIVGGGDQVKDAYGIGVSFGRIFTYKGDVGVVKTNIAGRKSEIITPKDSQWGEIAAIGSFGGNFYLVDRGKSLVWKYTPITESSYSPSLPFGPSGLSLGRAVAVAIDGSVWVLGSDATIQKIVKDGSDAYRIVGLDKDLGSGLAFYTDENAEDLYILDPNNSRVLVVGKDGVYKKQYVSKELNNALDIVVDEKARAAFVLDGAKIKKFDL